MIISRFHPDGAQPLLAVVAGVLEAMGAQVRIDADGDNLVRASEPGDGTTLGFVIEAQGLPNLLHELVHVVQLGRLERDHGTPYRAIPFDVENPAFRTLLWEELACCVVSCAYLAGGEPEVDHWFADQVGIQQDFFCLGADRASFIDALDRLARAHAGELEATVARAYNLTRAALQQHGTAGDLCRPHRAFTFAELWRRARS